MTSAAEFALVKIAVGEYVVGDFAGMLALADPMIRWDDRAIDPVADLVVGREEVLAHLGSWIDEWQEWEAEIEDVRGFEGRIVAVYTERGLEATVGIEREEHRAAVITVERGAITGWTRYLSEGEAMRAARSSGDGATRRF
jgi:hypothetical protein